MKISRRVEIEFFHLENLKQSKFQIVQFIVLGNDDCRYEYVESLDHDINTSILEAFKIIV